MTEMSAPGSDERQSVASVPLVDTWARRKGANRVHAIRVPDDLLLPATYLGAACTLIEGPIVARCGVKLAGQLFRIPDEYVEGWRKQRHVCPTCEFAVRQQVAA